MKQKLQVLVLITVLSMTTFATKAWSQSKESPKVTSRDSTAISNQETKDEDFYGRIIKLDRMKIARGLGSLLIEVNLPRGYHFTDKAPSRISWSLQNGKVATFADSTLNGSEKKAEFPFRLPIEAYKGKTELILDASVILCSDEDGICLLDNIRIRLPLRVSKEGSHKLTVQIDAEAPELGR